jgi:hypothetical protein
MLLRNLFEAAAPDADAAFAFGRFNPAHQGHIEVYKAVQQAGNKWFIGTNPSTHGPNDPLSFEEKSAWMQAIYPPIKGHILPEQSVVTLASKLYEMLGDDKTIAYVTDSNDWAWAGKLLNDYNGKEGPHGYYKFRAIKHVESPRVSSATALRTAARANDEAAFYAASGTDPKLTINGQTYFDTVVAAVGANPEKPKRVAKKKEQGVTESVGTMPTAEYVKGIYAAAAENGMGAPDVEAVRKQMVLAANGEVDIMATMQKSLQVFQDPKFKQMLADLDALIKKAESGQGVAEGDRPGMKDGRPYSDPLRRHPGNDSYMTPEYLIQKYQDELKKIAAGPYKRPKDVAMYQARIAKLQRQQGVAEGAPIVVAQAPINVRNPKKAPQPYRNQGDIVPPTKPPSTEKRGVKGRPGQRPMPKYDEGTSNAMADTAKRLSNKDDGKVAKLRAAGDKRREEELKGRNIAKRNESVDLKTSLQELSNDMLGKYKKAAGADASKADKEGNVKRGDKRFSGIVKATNKQFANDAKKTK